MKQIATLTVEPAPEKCFAKCPCCYLDVDGVMYCKGVKLPTGVAQVPTTWKKLNFAEAEKKRPDWCPLVITEVDT